MIFVVDDVTIGNTVLRTVIVSESWENQGLADVSNAIL